MFCEGCTNGPLCDRGAVSDGENTYCADCTDLMPEDNYDENVEEEE